MKNEQEALDVVSEAVYKGLTHLKTLTDMSFFTPWMTRIIINTALDSIKKNKRFVTFEDYMVEDKNCTPVLEEEIKFDVYAAMDILPPDEKTCIILKYFEEYSFKDIAVIMEMPESTVKSKVYRALNRMRKYMEGDEK